MRPRLLSLVLLLTVALGGLLFPLAQAQDSAVGLLKQMIAIAADNGGVGHTAELNALKEQIEALPKPARGDRKTARTANDAGLAALKAMQFEQAKKYFLSAFQADPADVEIAGNLGFATLKTGDFKLALKTLSAALALAPGRAPVWFNLAEYFAVQGQQQQAVACYALTYHFSKDQDKTRSFLQKSAAESEEPKVRQAMQQALQLSLISGNVEGETVADASADDSLDAPLPPTAPAPRSLPPAAPVTPLPAPPASVATSPIPASLLPPASPKPDVTVAPPAPNTNAAAGSGKDDIVEVVAQGMGIDQPSAMSNAYSNAVQQALGLYVDAETMVQNDQIVRDQILTYSKGFIQKVDIVSQNQANGLFQVNIRAQVKRQKLLEQAKANNITVKSVEGVNIHAQAVSQIKQEQDANALLTKALSPFTGVALYRADLVGEPKIVKKDQDSVTLAYPVSLYVDETSYNTAIRGLIDVLDKVASEKNEETGEYKRVGRDDVPKGEIWEVMFPPSRPLSSKIEDYSDYRKKSLIAIMAWKDKSFTKSKWLFYNLPSDLSLKELKIPSTYNRIIVNLDLLNKGNELIALGNEVAAGVNGSALQKPFEGDDYEVILKSYFSVDRQRAYPKSQFEVNVTVSTQDLPTVQSAKLEVKMK